MYNLFTIHQSHSHDLNFFLSYIITLYISIHSQFLKFFANLFVDNLVQHNQFIKIITKNCYFFYIPKKKIIYDHI